MRNIKVKVNKQLLGVMAVLGLLTACGPGKMDYRSYVNWVEGTKSGLMAEKDLDDYEYQILYKPLDYMVAKEYLNGAITREQIAARTKEYGTMQYYTLRIKSKHANELLSANIHSEEEYYGRLEYFMSGMAKDIQLIDGQDTLPCVLYHYERNYGLSAYNSFVLGFDNKKQSTEDKTLVYDDQVLGSGKVMMKIKGSAIAGIPAIQWN